MSIIERAIDRLDGKPDPRPKRTPDPVVLKAPVDEEVVEEVVSTEPALEATEPQSTSEVSKQAAEAPPEMPVETSNAALELQAEADPANGNYVALDFDALVADGFLSPVAPLTRMSEEFQFIKRRIISSSLNTSASKPQNLVMVTSSLPSEGKTFTSVNLALSLAMEMDRTVLAIDADIVKSDLSRRLGVKDRMGLFDVLAREDVKLDDVLVRTNVPNLVILPAGNNYGMVTEMLASDAMQALTDEVAKRYPDRIVIFDSPPILATTGATALAPKVGQVLMVVEAERTSQRAIKDALETLAPVEVAGMILNKTKRSSLSSDYRYGYGYGYYHPTK